MSNKYISILIILLGLLLMPNASSVKAINNDAILKLAPDSLTVNSGDSFYLDVQIENTLSNHKIITAGFDISFPPELLQVIDFNLAEDNIQIDYSINDFVVNEPEFNNVSNQTGMINFTAGSYGISPLTQDLITLARINFQTTTNLNTNTTAEVEILPTVNTGVYITNEFGQPVNILRGTNGTKNANIIIRKNPTSSGGGGGGGGGGSRRDKVGDDSDDEDLLLSTEDQGENTDASGLFSDTKNDNPFYSFIQKLSSKQIINGYSDGSFKPSNPITRAEFIKILIGALGITLDETTSNTSFNDVSKENVFYPWITYSFEKGYIKGYEAGLFKPDEYISRYEAIVIILRAKDSELKEIEKDSRYFIDVDTPDIAKYTDIAYELKIISGYEDNTFKPANKITRAESAKIIVNTFLSE